MFAAGLVVGLLSGETEVSADDCGPVLHRRREVATCQAQDLVGDGLAGFDDGGCCGSGSGGSCRTTRRCGTLAGLRVVLGGRHGESELAARIGGMLGRAQARALCRASGTLDPQAVAWLSLFV